jgi:serine/threonine-protein kinase
MSLTTVDDRYQVTALIAAGGMGEVFRARDSVLEREVAVKVLHRNLAGDKGFVERFLREARAAANLNHPNIVSVYDWGTSADGTYFMVMELVSGRNLHDLLAINGPLEPAQAVAVLTQTLAALAHAHSQGIIHRDIKPENILVTNNGVVKVADFGLARALAESRVTQAPGTVTGTARYLAPEQIQGSPADARTDIYSLGVVAYEMLTGRAPFEGETSVAIAYKHLEEKVPAPSALAPGTPPELDRIVEWATEKDPNRRPDSAAALAVALARAAVAIASPGRLAALAQETGSGGRVARIDLPLDEATTITIPAASNEMPVGEAASKPPVSEGRGDKRRRGRGKVLVVIAVLVALAAVSAWGAFGFIVPREVPSVVGMQESAAEHTLSGAGFRTILGSGVFSSHYGQGVIASQSVPAGSKARPHSAIVLQISKGPEIVAVPGVAGLSQEKATAALEKAGLQVDVKQQFDDHVPKGEVISQSPRPHDNIDSGTKVTLTVSKGPPPVSVPDLAGLNAKDAEGLLKSAGLVFAESEKYSNSVDRGKIISQDPGAKSVVDRGSRVKLVVSLGSKSFAMPDLTGMDASSAVAKLKSLGLVAKITQIPGSNGSKVVGQQPAAGKTVDSGSTVTIFVGG